jgi:hypothetical protein
MHCSAFILNHHSLFFIHPPFLHHFRFRSQISTGAKVTGHLPSATSWPPRSNEGLAEALTGADIVVIPAGVPRKPGMTRDDLFNVSTYTEQ